MEGAPLESVFVSLRTFTYMDGTVPESYRTNSIPWVCGAVNSGMPLPRVISLGSL